MTTATALRRFEIDKAHSEATFQVRHLISKVRGRFSDFSGTIESCQFGVWAVDGVHSSTDTRMECRAPRMEESPFAGRPPGRWTADECETGPCNLGNDRSWGATAGATDDRGWTWPARDTIPHRPYGRMATLLVHLWRLLSPLLASAGGP